MVADAMGEEVVVVLKACESVLFVEIESDAKRETMLQIIIFACFPD